MFTEEDQAQIIALVTPILEATLTHAVQTAGISTATTTWRPGIATAVNASTGAARVVVDGDTNPINLTIIGATPAVGARVMVVFVPPSAVFALSMTGDVSGPFTYTPTVDQGVTANLTTTINEARFIVSGPEIEFWLDITLGSAGTAGSTVLIDLPRPAIGHGPSAHFGEAMYYDSSTTTRYQGGWEFAASFGQIGVSPGGVFAGLWGNTPSLAAASGDVIRGHGAYLWR